MHYSALQTGKLFFETYVSKMETPSVVEIGSQNINGCLRDVKSENVTEYIGLDFAEGDGVDIVLTDAYTLPFENNKFDVLVSSSCFEHAEMFWLSYLEGLRVLKDDGLMYINAPSAWMMYHRFPVDCWRFWPDAGKALETWGKYSGYNNMVLESYITPPGRGELVADFVCIIAKNADHADKHTRRMIDDIKPGGFFNGFRFPKTEKFPDGWDKPTRQLKQDVLLPTGPKQFTIR